MTPTNAKRDALASVLMAFASRIRGERKSISMPYGFSMGGSGWGEGWKNPSHAKLVEANSGYTGIATSLISSEVAKVQPELYMTRGDEWIAVEQHESLSVLMRPNEHMDYRRLIKLTELSLLTLGNALWLIETPARGFEPESICLVPWESVTPKYDPDGKRGIIGWKIGPKQIPIEAERCIHFMEEDATTATTGIGRPPTLRAADAIDLGRGAAEANARYLRIGSILSLILTMKGGGEWSDESKRAVEQDLSIDHAGAKNAHRALLLQGEVDAKVIAPGSTDMDFGNALTWSMEMELANLFVPPAVLGMVKDFNRANMDAAMASFARLAILPRVERYLGSDAEKHLPGTLELEYFSRWEPRGNSEWRVSHPSIVPRDRAEDRADAKMLMGEGTGITLADINEMRERFGFSEREEADARELFIQSGKLKLSEERPNQQPIAFSLGGPAETKAMSDEAKAAHSERYIIWKRFAAQHARHEKRLSEKLKPEYKKQEAEVISRIKRNYPKAIALFGAWGREKARKALLERRDIIDDIFPKDDRKRIARAVESVYRDAIKEAARASYRRLGIRVPKKDGSLFDLPGIANPIADEAVDEFIKDAALLALSEVDDATIKKLKAAFADVIADGGGLNDITARIRDIYDEFDRSRAFTIARTEMTGAWNWGSQEAANSLGLNLVKRWLPAFDDRTRDDHADAGDRYGEGRGIPMDENYEVGGDSLAYPGDPSASPEQRINCRCTEIYEEVAA